MSDPTKEDPTNIFPRLAFAELSTGHVTESDGNLVTRKGSELPGVIATYDEGWFSYVPDCEHLIEHMADLDQAGFSQHYQNLIFALRLHGLDYVRFDSDAPMEDRLPVFEW